MLIRRLLEVLVLAVTIAPAQGQQIEQTYTYTADLTRDGIPDLVSVRITGPDIRKPFRWSVVVTDSSKKRLFSIERDDSWMDEFFGVVGDNGYMPDCESYEACKRLYYFKWIPEEISGCLRPGHAASFVSRLGGNDNSVNVAVDFLRKNQVEPLLIEQAVKELKEALNAQETMSLCISYSGVQDDPPLVWLKSVRRFVPYYSP